MSVHVESWWTTATESGIRVPGVPFEYAWCIAEHTRTGFLCTRADEHTGRHAATTYDGAVWAVWS